MVKMERLGLRGDLKLSIGKNITYVFVFLSFLGVYACGTGSDQDTQNGNKTSSIRVPAFNRDSAYSFIEKQVSFGPRVPGTQAHSNCLAWIIGQFEKSGAVIQQQDFEISFISDERVTATNIVASINPQNKRRILLGAHWDTRYTADQDPNEQKRDLPILGADDGASGVGVLLEIARVLNIHPINLGVDFIFFDAEDQGEAGSDETWCLGAQYWSSNIVIPSHPQYGILLDMVGSKGAVFRKEGFSILYARSVVEKVWSLAKSMGYGSYFSDDQLPPITDDHRFVNEIAKIPMINIINRTREGNFGSYWHTHQDDMSIIDRSTLRAVGQVVLAVLYRESDMSI